MKHDDSVRRVMFHMPKGSVKTLEEVCKALGGSLISSESVPSKIKSWEDLKYFLFSKGVSNPETFILDLLNLSHEGAFAFLVTAIYMANNQHVKGGTITDFLNAQKDISENITEYEEILGDKFLSLLNDSKGE